MAKGGKSKFSSKETYDEALNLARSLQRPGQSKEETKMIAQGIQRGLEQYKKLHSAKTRELDKRVKKMKRASEQHEKENASVANESVLDAHNSGCSWAVCLPWVLLALSWMVFAGYVLL
jgi:hypothetical protein